jgi:hypothetical protein
MMAQTTAGSLSRDASQTMPRRSKRLSVVRRRMRRPDSDHRVRTRVLRACPRPPVRSGSGSACGADGLHCQFGRRRSSSWPASDTACGVSTPRPRRRTSGPAGMVSIPSPASRCCARPGLTRRGRGRRTPAGRGDRRPGRRRRLRPAGPGGRVVCWSRHPGTTAPGIGSLPASLATSPPAGRGPAARRLRPGLVTSHTFRRTAATILDEALTQIIAATIASSRSVESMGWAEIRPRPEG